MVVTWIDDIIIIVVIIVVVVVGHIRVIVVIAGRIGMRFIDLSIYCYNFIASGITSTMTSSHN
jgi:hypothetical protein